MFQQLAQVHNAPKVGAPPVITLESGTGFTGTRTAVIQVQINFWDGRVSGAKLDVMGGKIHRFAVTRICDLAEFQENPGHELAMKRKLGKKHQDRVLRPVGRLDAILPKSGPYGLSKLNMRPWMNAVQQITEAAQWAVESANAQKLSTFGLLMAVELSAERTITPSDTRFPSYQEVEIVGILAAEVCELDQNVIEQEVSRAPITRARPRIAAGDLDD